MTCKIERPDPQTLFNRYRDQFSNIVLGGAPVIPESNEWYATSLNYAMAEEFYAISEQQWKERDPRYACCENLYKLAAIDGVFPAAATFSQGYVRLTGTPGTVLPSSFEAIFAAKNYRTVGSSPSAINDQGFAIVRMAAVIPGEDGNLTGTTTGQLLSSIPSVDRTVTLLGGQTCGGQEAETCEEFRIRYLNRIKYQPNATAAWLQAKLLEWPCVTRVCMRAGECCEEDECACGDNLGFYVLFDDTFDCGLPPQCVIDDIQTWLFGDPQGFGLGQVPIGVCGQLYTAEPAVIDVVIDGYPCITASQRAEVDEQIADLFRTLCPSTALDHRQIEIIIGNIVGASQPFSVRFRSESPRVRIEDCCGVTPECDVALCLGEIEYIAPELQGECIA